MDRSENTSLPKTQVSAHGYREDPLSSEVVETPLLNDDSAFPCARSLPETRRTLRIHSPPPLFSSFSPNPTSSSKSTSPPILSLASASPLSMNESNSTPWVESRQTSLSSTSVATSEFVSSQTITPPSAPIPRFTKIEPSSTSSADLDASPMRRFLTSDQRDGGKRTPPAFQTDISSSFWTSTSVDKQNPVTPPLTHHPVYHSHSSESGTGNLVSTLKRGVKSKEPTTNLPSVAEAEDGPTFPVRMSERHETDKSVLGDLDQNVTSKKPISPPLLPPVSHRVLRKTEENCEASNLDFVPDERYP